MFRRVSLSVLMAVVLVAAVAPVATAVSPGRIDLPDGFRPEGITSDGNRRVWVGSLADGAIWHGDLETGVGSILVPGTPGSVAVGIDLDRHRQRLWVAGGGTSEVRVYDSQTGAHHRTWTFASGFINDLVVTRRAVYATDSNIQQLIVIPLGPGGALPAVDEAFTLPLTGDLAYTTGFNLNGIDQAGPWLVAVQSNTGLLFRIDPETGQTWRIDTGGYPLTNGDGVEVRGHKIHVVRNRINVIAMLRADEQFLTATLEGEITSPPAPANLDVPTTISFAEGRLWAVNARFTTPPEPGTDYWITQLRPKPPA